jgi:ribosome-associated protein
MYLGRYDTVLMSFNVFCTSTPLYFDSFFMAHIFITTEAELNPGFNPEKPSKSLLKRQMDDLQTLGGRLIGLSKEKLMQLDLPERLFDAVLEAKKITANGATARQLQFIGKQMRYLDEAQVQFIQEKFLAWDGLSKSETTKLHLIEYWRDTLLEQDTALQAYLDVAPATTPDQLQAMRMAIRQARKDASTGKPPKNARILFQLIKETLHSTPTVSNQPHNDD